MATEDSTCNKDIEHQTSSANSDAGIENESSVITNDQIGFSEDQRMSKSDSNICNKGIEDCTSSADSNVGTKSDDISDILECFGYNEPSNLPVPKWSHYMFDLQKASMKPLSNLPP